MIKMTELEVKVLNILKNNASFDQPIQAKDLRRSLGISKRKLEEVVESLRVTFRQPIVAKKTKPSGYYIPRTNEERQAGVAAYQRQIETEQRNLGVILSVDLQKYWNV